MFRILILNIFLSIHPVHVTLITVNQVQDNDTLKLFFRMYFDDFKRDYKLYNHQVKPDASVDTINFSKTELNEFFNDRVSVSVNRKPITGKLTDVSINSYEICLNLFYLAGKNPKEFSIRNTVLTRIFSDQANMVYLNINKYEGALKLTVEKPEGSVSLK